MTAASASLPLLLDRIAPARRCDGRLLQPLDDPRSVWFVRHGDMDLFHVRMRDGVPVGPRRFLGSLPAGSWLPGCAATAEGDLLVALGLDGALLTRLDQDALAALAANPGLRPSLAEGLDRWVTILAHATVDASAHPKFDLRLSPGDRDQPLAPGQAASSVRGVVWVAAPGAEVVPLTPESWLTADSALTLTAWNSADVLAMQGWDGPIESFARRSMAALAAIGESSARAEAERLARRAQSLAEEMGATLARFTNALEARRVDRGLDGLDPLVAACTRVARVQGLAITDPPRGKDSHGDPLPPSLAEVARASKLRTRQVALRGAWWSEDNGPLLAQWEETKGWVALIPAGPRSYELHDPQDGSVHAVDEDMAEKLSPFAHILHGGLPDRPVTLLDLAKFGLVQSRGDLGAVLLTGLVGGLLTMILPPATAYLFDTLIPGRENGQLLQLGLGILMVSWTALVVKLAGDIATLRLEGRIASGLQAAVIDRVLRLPVRFFSSYAAGDLSSRILTVDSLRRTLTAFFLQSVTSLLFAASSFLLLLWYFPVAAAVAGALMALLLGVSVLVGLKQLRVMFEGEALEGNLVALLVQIIGGITKLRLAGAEPRAFGLWGRTFAEMRTRMVRQRQINNLYSAILSGYEILVMGAVFLVIGLLRDDDLSTGAFLAFVTAFTTFSGAALQLSRAVVQLFSLKPFIERARPILNAEPESDAHRQDPGELHGACEMTQVSFRYAQGGPRVLSGVSITARPGEFIALVGPSGGGKSTIMKLLLGFEQPEMGGIFFDGQDLRNLDSVAVRRQIGVVLQNGKVMPGSIFENIAGANDCSLDEAWEAARAAGLEDDIRAMPMGMHTVLSEGSAALSGGQLQRLLIARALVGRPRLLLFDEATSALDNRTQALVTESLGRLAVTRIVIAHRLSTIKDADRIYVLDRGRVAEHGSYGELMERDGLFAQLARRQLT